MSKYSWNDLEVQALQDLLAQIELPPAPADVSHLWTFVSAKTSETTASAIEVVVAAPMDDRARLFTPAAYICALVPDNSDIVAQTAIVDGSTAVDGKVTVQLVVSEPGAYALAILSLAFTQFVTGALYPGGTFTASAP